MNLLMQNMLPEAVSAFLWLLLMLIPLALWLWALIDALRSRFQEENMKIIWVLVIIFVPILGFILYFFIAPAQKIKDHM